MVLKLLFFCFITILQPICSKETSESFMHYPCSENQNIFFYVEPALSHEEKYFCILIVNEKLEKGTTIKITIKESTSSAAEATNSSISKHASPYNEAKLFDDYTFLGYETYTGVLNETVTMLGLPMDVPTAEVPVIQSVLINGSEKCQESGSTDLKLSKEDANKVYNQIVELMHSIHESEDCGLRKKNKFTPLIVHGIKTAADDWPWHVALYKRNDTEFEYICGGTIISKYYVLTAAHCVVDENGEPISEELLNVYAGITTLSFGDASAVEKKVKEIIVYPDYDNNAKQNDIALLRLGKRFIYNEHVQPACLWKPELLDKILTSIFGTVVGWGLNDKNEVSTDLMEATLPKISNSECVKDNNLLAERLSENNFCAGYKNGTTPCNGDSGGGFHVFLPLTPGDKSPTAPGRWYVHGVVSLAVAVGAFCDHNNYALFTTVEKFTTWIHEYL